MTNIDINPNFLKVINKFFKTHYKPEITKNDIDTTETLKNITNMYKKLMDHAGVDYKEIETSYSIEKKSYTTIISFLDKYSLTSQSIITSTKLTDEEIANNLKPVLILYFKNFKEVMEPYEAMLYYKMYYDIYISLSMILLHSTEEHNIFLDIEYLYSFTYQSVQKDIKEIAKENNFSYKQLSMFEEALNVKDITNKLLGMCICEKLDGSHFSEFKMKLNQAIKTRNL